MHLIVLHIIKDVWERTEEYQICSPFRQAEHSYKGIFITATWDIINNCLYWPWVQPPVVAEPEIALELKEIQRLCKDLERSDLAMQTLNILSIQYIPTVILQIHTQENTLLYTKSWHAGINLTVLTNV